MVPNNQSKVSGDLNIIKCGFFFFFFNAACNMHWLVAIGFITKIKYFSFYMVPENIYFLPYQGGGGGMEIQGGWKGCYLSYFYRGYFPNSNCPIFYINFRVVAWWGSLVQTP